MMTSVATTRLKFRSFQTVLLLTATIAVSLGSAAAQDYEAVDRRLRKAVKKGEITRQQADTMMIALKKSADKKAHAECKAHGDEALGRKLKAAVAAGKLTEEEAMEKWKAIQKGAGARQKKEMDKQQYYEALARKIKSAVKEGKLTEKEAAAKWAEIKKRAALKDD